MLRLGRMFVLSMLTAGSLMVVGCGESETTPPPGTDTETPVLDIEEGTATSPDQATSEDEPGKGAGAESKESE
ncbi:MAG: hypothetical protein ACQESR_20645 [Planctomycetota bacterium]